MSIKLFWGWLKTGAAVCLLSACAVGGNKAAQPTLFDLGPAQAAGSIRLASPVPELQLTELSAPPWLATTGIAYRLAYLSEFQTQYYRDSRWLAAPGVLLTERMRQKAALAPRSERAKPLALRLELVEFEQRFSSPTLSEVRISLRVRLGDSTTLLQTFEVVRASLSPDAAGAVHAFSEASDEILAQVLAWAALNAKFERN